MTQRNAASPLSSSAEVLEFVRAITSIEPPARAVVGFGSAFCGVVHETSDIDILVVSPDLDDYSEARWSDEVTEFARRFARLDVHVVSVSKIADHPVLAVAAAEGQKLAGDALDVDADAARVRLARSGVARARQTALVAERLDGILATASWETAISAAADALLTAAGVGWFNPRRRSHSLALMARADAALSRATQLALDGHLAPESVIHRLITAALGLAIGVGQDRAPAGGRTRSEAG